MIYITQLIFVNQGEEETFLKFESFAIPLIEKCNGKVIYRIRPDENDFVDNDQSEIPYEIHFISFDSEKDLNNFLNNDERLKHMHLKEKSVKSMLLVKGEKM